MRKMWSTICIGSAVSAGSIILGACSTAPDVPSVAELLSADSKQDGRACLLVRDIRGYGVNREEFIFIDGSRGYYLATANPGCMDLATTPQIAFIGHLTRLCGGRMDKIQTRDYECTIKEIYSFENRDAASAAYDKAVGDRRALLEQ